MEVASIKNGGPEVYEENLLLTREKGRAGIAAQAESYEVSPDSKTYTFYLKNTSWSDGSPVTAYDFEKTWLSILDPNFPSPDAYLLYSIKNAKCAKEGKLPLNQVAIQAKDAKTLVVELEMPTPYFLQILASSVLLPVNADKDQSDPNWPNQPEQLLSNGPFIPKQLEKLGI